jgi:hypothetical protein
VCWTKAHKNIFFLSKVFHHNVLGNSFKVFATAPASNPSDSASIAAPARNPNDSSSMSLVNLWLRFLIVVRMNEGHVGP